MSDVKAFVDTNLAAAQAVAQKIGVDPMVILGQWGLETGWGKSVVPGTNNLGNVKGPGVAATDNQTGATDQYRAYSSPAQFGANFSNVIASRFPGAVGSGPDAIAYANALKPGQQGGYAEDPQYASKLAGAAAAARTASGIDIDPSKVQWESPAKGAAQSGNTMVPGPSLDPQIDASKVKWDATPAPAAQPNAPKQPNQSAASQPPAQPPAGASWPGGELGRQLGLTARAAGHGIADTVDLVGAPLNATINTLFGAHLHNPGDTIRAGVDAVTPAPQNALERVVNAGASGVAGAAMGAGAAGAVSKVAANPLVQTIASQMAAAPGMQMAAGAGAGSASQGAQEAGASPLVQMAAGLGGGIAGGVAGAGVAAAGNRLARSLGPSVAPLAAADRVEPSMGGQPGATGAGGASAQAAPDWEVGADGVARRPNMGGGAAGSPQGAAAAAAGGRGSMGAAGTSFASQARAEGVPDSLVQKIAAQEQAGTLNATAAERHIEAGSLPVPVELTAGQATGDVNLLSHEQNIRGKAPELAERFNAQNGQLAANFDAIRDRVAPDVNVPSGTPIGQALVDAYKQADAPIQEQIARAYEGARNADGTPALVDSAGAMRDFESEIGPTRFRALPSRVQQIFSDAKNNVVALPEAFDRSAGATRPLTARDLMDIDQTLSGAIGETKNTSVQHDIGLLRQAILDAPISPAAGPEAMAAFKAAQAQARARFQAMAADPAYKAAVNDGVGAGEPSPLADGFVQKYVAGGKTANVQNMLQNLSGDPLNQQYIAAGLLDHVKSQAGIDLRTGTGNVSQAALNKTIQNLGQKSDLVFGGDNAQTLDKLGNVARYTQEQPRGSYVNNSNTFTAAAADYAKSALEGAANVAAKGVPVGTWARKMLAKRSFGKEVSQSLEPGAGLNKLKSAMGKN